MNSQDTKVYFEDPEMSDSWCHAMGATLVYATYVMAGGSARERGITIATIAAGTRDRDIFVDPAGNEFETKNTPIMEGKACQISKGAPYQGSR